MERGASRRELVVGACAAATGVAVAGRLVPAPRADAAVPSDRALLADALEVERLMVLAYGRVLASGALSPGIERAIAPHLPHERAHVSTVAAQLGRLGAPVPTGVLSLRAASVILGRHHVSGSLTDLHSEHDCLKLLVDLESAAEGVYYEALKDLRHPGLVRLSAQIMACEAQHWTVLSGLRNPGQYVKAIPWPYVYGSK